MGILNLRRHWMLVMAFASLLFAFMLWRHALQPYYPRHFDDAEHWLFTYKLYDALRSASSWAEQAHLLFWFRSDRTISFPLLGLPFLFLGWSVTMATALLQSLFYTGCGLVFYAIFRFFGSGKAISMLSALFLLLVPATFAAAGVYLAELPFLFFCSAAALARLKQRFHLQGILIGLALTLRPVEGAAGIAIAVVADFYLLRPRWAVLIRAWGISLAWIAAITLGWFLPFRERLIEWIVPALATPTQDEPLQYRQILFLFMDLLSPAMVAMGLVATGLEWFQGRGLRRTAFAWLVFFLPLGLALYSTNVVSILESRRYLIFLTLAWGLFASLLVSRARLLAFLLAVQALQAVGPDAYQEMARLLWRPRDLRVFNPKPHPQRDAWEQCLKMVEGLGQLDFPERETTTFYLVTSGNLPLSSLICSVVARGSGRKWDFEDSIEAESQRGGQSIFILDAPPASYLESSDAALVAGLQDQVARGLREAQELEGGIQVYLPAKKR